MRRAGEFLRFIQAPFTVSRDRARPPGPPRLSRGRLSPVASRLRSSVSAIVDRSPGARKAARPRCRRFASAARDVYRLTRRAIAVPDLSGIRTMLSGLSAKNASTASAIPGHAPLP